MARFFHSCFGGKGFVKKKDENSSPVNCLTDAEIQMEFIKVVQNSVIPKGLYRLLDPCFSRTDQLGSVHSDILDKVVEIVYEVILLNIFI